MTFLLDPNHDWETAWTQQNPEPYIEPKHPDKNGHFLWTLPETFERMAWHRRRWEAFKSNFPTWAEVMYGINSR